MFLKIFAVTLIISLFTVNFIDCMAVKIEPDESTDIGVKEPDLKASKANWVVSHLINRLDSVASLGVLGRRSPRAS